MDNHMNTPSQLNAAEQSDPTILHRRPTVEQEGRASKRPRASKPKVKSGCLTCKARRIKCDETKPHCLRCQKFGRTCDGYVSTPTPPRGFVSLQPRIPTTILYTPSISIHVSEDESRYFQVFADRAAHELSGYFDNQFWSHIVLQESHNVTAIRHAAIALGALNESLSMAPSPQLKVNVIQTFEKRHHEQAVLHYLKAIQLLNQYISDSPQMRTALIACMLFVCFETIQGSFAASIQQQYGGLKLLRSYYKGKESTQPEGGALQQKNSRKELTAGSEDVQSDSVISSQIKAYLESGIVQEEPQSLILTPTIPTLQDSQSGTTNQSWMSNQTLRTLNVGHVDFTEPAYQTAQPFSFVQRSFDTHHRDIAPNPTTDAHRGRPPQTKHIPTTSITDTGTYSERLRTMSTFSLDDNSSAYSSDSGSYRESSPHRLQAKTVPRKSSLATSLSNMSTNDPHTPPLAGSESADDRAPENCITSSIAPRQPILQSSIDVEDTIIQTFARLDGPGLFFGMTPGIPVLLWDINKTWHLPIPAHFSSFSSAQRCWDFLMDRCLQFYRKTLFNRAYRPQMQDSDEVVASQHEGFLEQIADFERSFEPILDEAISPDGRVVHAASLVLSLYTKCTAIMLSQTTTPSEMIYDTFFSSFQYIVQTCSLLISSENELQDQLPRNRRFSFDFGIIPPLHVTATKCRDPQLRRKAVDLLFASPRQEGLWDSVLSARIGRWLIASEEEGIDLPSFDEHRGVFEGADDKSTGRSSEKVGRKQNLSTPLLREDMAQKGGFESGLKISELVNLSLGRGPRGEGDSSSSPVPHTMNLPQRVRKPSNFKVFEGKGKSREEKSPSAIRDQYGNKTGTGGISTVPERNRAQLTVVSFHLPDRYIKVKCQRVIADADGKKEERETVIAW